MAMRPRTPNYRAQPSPRPVYEKFQPKSEMKENQDAYLLHVYLPGFTKERIRINFVSSTRMLRVMGERPIDGGNIRWSRFEQTYPVPENCEVEKLEGKFERGTLIITMPKKFIPKVTTPKQAQAQVERTTKEKAQSPPPKKAHEPNISSPKPKPQTTRVDPPITIGEKDKKIPENNVEEETWNKPQKGEKVIEPKRAFSMDPMKQIEEKRQEEIRQKTILQTVKKQLHDDEKEKSVTKNEVKEENIGNKPNNESIRKKQEKYIDPNVVLKEKEIKARKESPKATESSKGSETTHKEKKNEDENYSTIGKGIKEIAASASEVITKIGEGKLDEKDKPLVANMGAAILVIVALGTYVTYKFTSSSGRT